VVAVHYHDPGLYGFVVEDSSSYSGGRNISCKVDLENTEPDRLRTAYMPVTIWGMLTSDYVKMYVDLGHLFM
jgi:hypothetical protein